jgi:hypothetical protein
MEPITLGELLFGSLLLLGVVWFIWLMDGA